MFFEEKDFKEKLSVYFGDINNSVIVLFSK